MPKRTWTNNGCGEEWGQERMHGIDKMDTEGRSKEGKLGIWKKERMGWG